MLSVVTARSAEQSVLDVKKLKGRGKWYYLSRESCQHAKKGGAYLRSRSSGWSQIKVTCQDNESPSGIFQ